MDSYNNDIIKNRKCYTASDEQIIKTIHYQKSPVMKATTANVTPVVRNIVQTHCCLPSEYGAYEGKIKINPVFKVLMILALLQRRTPKHFCSGLESNNVGYLMPLCLFHLFKC